MTGTVHIFDFLAQDLADLPSGLCPVFGTDRFLKRLAIEKLVTAFAGGDADFSPQNFEGGETAWADVNDELATRSLFGGSGPKLIVVDQADTFVTANRERLEDVANNGCNGLLVILVEKWAANTRLYKAANKKSCQIQCTEPLQGRSKRRDDKAVQKWLVERAEAQYGYKLPAAGSQTIIDLTDCNFGQMDQELQKLALYADKSGKVTQAVIKQAVGGWRTRTMWEALDAAIDGDAKAALTLLDQLIRGGEYPLALFGQLAWSLRRYGQATEIVYQQMRSGQKPRLGKAIQEAGFKNWNGELENSEKRLKQLGSQRAGQILDWIREADLQLKRSHSKEDRGRLVLEKLIVRMSSQLAPTA